MTIPPTWKGRRVQIRRIEDRVAEDLYKTCSTSHCHSCMERFGDAVLLLDNQRRFLFATSQMQSIINKSNNLFTLMPKFTLHTSQNTTRVEAFFNEKNNQVDPLVLLLKNEKDHTMLLLYGFRLPEPSISNLAAARFLIKIRDPSQNSIQQWLFFTEQFALTQAETRLCRALADGLTLNDCSVNWKVTTNTLRSQLNSIFSKTSTRRQVDLLRLINLFLRT